MQNSYATVLGVLEWSSDSKGLTFTFRNRATHLLWHEVTAVGVVESARSLTTSATPPQLFSDFARFLPGVDRLVQVNERIAADYRTLVLARGPVHNRAVRIVMPIDDDASEALLAEVRRHVRCPWHDDVALDKSYAQLGIKSPWWTVPAAIAFVLVLSFAVGSTCLVTAWLPEALRGGTEALPPVVWVGLVLWLAIIGSIVYIYRRVWWP